MIEKLLFWNIRSVNTQNAFGRLIDLHRRYKYSFIALMEPFQDPSGINQYKRRLGLDNARVNASGKIWIFLEDTWTGSLLMDSTQQITMKFCKNNLSCIISSVYTRYDSAERMEL